MNVRFEQEKKRFPSVFIYDVIIRHAVAKILSLAMAHGLAGRGLFSWITAGLDDQMDKFVTRIPSPCKVFL